MEKATMTSENSIPDPYESVLLDLRAKRDQINQAIRLLESLRSGGAPASASAPNGGLPENESVDSPGAFLGMSIHEAAKKLLAARRRALGNAEIAAALKAGGLVMNSADPINLMGSILTRRAHQVVDIVKVGRGIWGLKEWYPNRTFKSGSKAGGEAAKGETSAPEQPSAPIGDVPQG
jgi:hypothetical protein